MGCGVIRIGVWCHKDGVWCHKDGVWCHKDWGVVS